MFGMSGTEMIIILVLALLLLGPDKLPEVAKMLGKGMRDFNKATSDIKSTVESEFNKIAELEPEKPKLEPIVPRLDQARAGGNVFKLEPPPGVVASVEPENTIAPPAGDAAPAVEPAAVPDEKARS